MDVDITKTKSAGSKDDHFYDLLNTSTSGGSARTEAKPSDMADHNNGDNILPSYDFQNPAPRIASNGMPSPPLAGTSGVGFLKQPLPNVANNSGTSVPPPLQLPDNQEKLIVAAVDSAMKKYADNMVKILDGINGRLDNLSHNVGQIESNFLQNQNAFANSLGELDGRTRGIEHTLYEVQRSLQVLRDKQEIAEELQRLQLGKAKESLAVPAPSPTAEDQRPVVDNTNPLGLQLVPSVSHTQGPTAPSAPSAPSAVSQIAASSQPSPYTPQPHPAQSSMSAPALEPQQMPPQQAPPVPQLVYAQGPQGQPGMQNQPPMQYQPGGQTPPQSSVGPPQQAPPLPQQQQQQQMLLPPGSQYPQQAPTSYSQQPQQQQLPPHPPPAYLPQSSQPQPQMQPQQYMQGPGMDGHGPYATPSGYAQQLRQPLPQGMPQMPPQKLQQAMEGPPRAGGGGYSLAPASGGGGIPPPMYDGAVPPGTGAYNPANAHQYHPSSGSGGPGYPLPQQGGGYNSSAYPPSLRRPLQTAQPVGSPPANSQPPSGSSSAGSGGGTGPQLSTSRLPIERVIDDVAKMGFSKDEVAAVVKKLTENGQSVELNIILDKLMSGGARQSEPVQKASSGWTFGR